jgi:hypothetical protein
MQREARSSRLAAGLLAGVVVSGAAVALLPPGSGGPVGAAPAEQAGGFVDPAFARVWTRTDDPVAAHQATRSWYWGPAPGRALFEVYNEGPGHIRQVQYFEKSRMEINDPYGDPTSKWFVTNGLLTVELVSGKVQTGNGSFVPNPSAPAAGPAEIPLASDADDANAPTYASFAGLANTPLGDHKVADRSGTVVQETVSRAGAVTPATDFARYGVRYVRFEPLTGHNIPTVFWEFLNGRGPVRENGNLTNAQLSDPWFFTSGLPISEAYWARVKVAGQMQDVLIQCFERRVLTYVPTNAPAWQVQVGNIGAHYQQWRYPRGLPPAQPTAVPTVGR